jgi:hypothetical protein
MASLEIEPVGDFLLYDIDRIVEGLQVHFAAEIKRRHRRLLGCNG